MYKFIINCSKPIILVLKQETFLKDTLVKYISRGIGETNLYE